MMKPLVSLIGYVMGWFIVVAVSALFALAAFFLPWEITAILKNWGLV
ncbi:MAG: hypothetical protein IJQ34_02075 [Kiritimatiellae bacterium]|nr:hypothetical protein [Kiritimatiellia bacterium]